MLRDKSIGELSNAVEMLFLERAQAGGFQRDGTSIPAFAEVG